MICIIIKTQEEFVKRKFKKVRYDRDGWDFSEKMCSQSKILMRTTGFSCGRIRIPAAIRQRRPTRDLLLVETGSAGRSQETCWAKTDIHNPQ